MPRSGVNGTYNVPPGTDNQQPLTVISSAMFNAFAGDVQQTFNTPQPIAYGGTNATTPIGAMDNLMTKGTDVATAATLNLDTASGQFVDLTGTTTVTAVTLSEGRHRMTRAAGNFQITVGASLIGNGGGANISVQTGDLIFWEGYSGGFVRFWVVRASGQAVTPPAPKGYIYNLTLSNNTADAANDIDIAAGEASSVDAAPSLLALASTLTKRFDAAWAVGSGNGGRFSAGSADGWYYLWLIRRPDTGVVDAGFSTNKTDPTPDANYPAVYTQRRYIGAVYRTGSAFKAFFQAGDDFIFLGAGIGEAGAANIPCSATSTLQSVTLPPNVWGKFRVRLSNGASSTVNLVVASANVSISLNTFEASVTSAASAVGATEVEAWVGTSSQVSHRVSSVAGSPAFGLTTYGWIDDRGKSS